MSLRVGIVGCGLIGNKRADAMSPPPSVGATKAQDRVVAVCDPNAKAAQKLADKTGAKVCASVAELLPLVDAVVVATTNDVLAPITEQAILAKKHVVVEKPAARSAKELEPLLAKAEAARVTVKVGFNHRFHPALLKAKAILDEGSCGPLMFVRGRYGHGGRVGYDKEWRAKPEMSGGGELIDQGVHLIDLARWYLGAELTRVEGHAATFFWDMPVDDNAFMTLRTASGQVAHLHVSCSEWKNLFSLEIYARDAKLHIDGLGGSYGVERLAHYKMKPEMGPPETTIYEYPGADTSWAAEWADFARAIEEKRRPLGDLHDALAALKVVQAIYDRGVERVGSR
jgi:predicted dehydrogenase